VKQHQEGRAPTNGANVPTFNFTEGWFRTSGLYDLSVFYNTGRQADELIRPF